MVAVDLVQLQVKRLKLYRKIKCFKCIALRGDNEFGNESGWLMSRCYLPMSRCGIAGLEGGPWSGGARPGILSFAGTLLSMSWDNVLPSWICWKLRRRVSPPGAWTIDEGSPATAGSSSSFSLPLYG